MLHFARYFRRQDLFSSTMTTDLQLYGRSILLEGYENGLNVDVALKRVNHELGSNGMSDDVAFEWYTEFANGNKGICKMASKANKKLIANGTFLPSQRASFASAYSDGHLRLNLCRLNGTDGRFQVYFSHGKNYVVDMFHGTTKRQSGFRNPIARLVCIKIKTVQLPYCRDYWLFETSILLHLYAEDSMRFAEINDDLVLVNPIDLPFKLYLSTIRDNNVCGFYYELGAIDVNKYVEFSLIDRTRKEFSIKRENLLERHIYALEGKVMEMTVNGDHLIVHARDKLEPLRMHHRFYQFSHNVVFVERNGFILLVMSIITLLKLLFRVQKRVPLLQSYLVLRMLRPAIKFASISNSVIRRFIAKPQNLDKNPKLTTKKVIEAMQDELRSREKLNTELGVKPTAIQRRLLVTTGLYAKDQVPEHVP
ncbi:hypothetical protein M3Y96_00175500 [Aphelenchoides besseyi]|nr:hypothetical protein M3Y96_00175500 [Aphelenchoides besseyi]